MFSGGIQVEHLLKMGELINMSQNFHAYYCRIFIDEGNFVCLGIFIILNFVFFDPWKKFPRCYGIF